MMYTNVLVPLDGSKLAECAIPHIEALVQKGLAKKVTFIRIAGTAHIPPGFISPANNNMFVNEKVWAATAQYNYSKAEYYLNKLVSLFNYSQTVVDCEVLPPGGIADAIARYAVKNGVDLIVMTTRARSGICRWLWGNIADQVISLVSIPVLMVRVPENEASL